MTRVAAKARTAGLLGACVRDLQSFGYRPTDARYEPLLQASMAVFDAERAATIPIQGRIAAADALALSGDPRLDWARPDRWVELPGGEFLMGAQKTNPRAEGHDPEAYTTTKAKNASAGPSVTRMNRIFFCGQILRTSLT